jgi:hypothetical protein
MINIFRQISLLFIYIIILLFVIHSTCKVITISPAGFTASPKLIWMDTLIRKKTKNIWIKFLKNNFILLLG